MTPLVWFSITAYVVSVAACAALALPFSHLTTRGRKKLDLTARQRGQSFAAKAGFSILPAALLLLLWEATNPQMTVAAWLLLLPAFTWAAVLGLYFKTAPRSGTPDGPDSDYEVIKARFPLAAITSEDEYNRARQFHENQVAYDRLAEKCGNEQERITGPQWRFMHELHEMIRAYAEKYPRLRYGQGWYDARQSQIRELESLLEQVTRLQTDSTANVGADHLNSATAGFWFMGLDSIKKFLDGPLEPNDFIGCIREIDNSIACELLRNLDQRITHARQAIRLLEAAARGEIRYEVPVRTLIARAGREKTDFAKVEALLQQAVAQAKNPDADTVPDDLIRALCGLALVYQHHLGRPADAEALYVEALPLQLAFDGAEHDNVPETLGRLSCVCFAQDKLTESVDYAKRQATMHCRQLPYNLSAATRALEWLAKTLAKSGQTAEAEATLKHNLAICEKYDRGMASGLDTIDALDELIAFLDQNQRFEEAAELVDRAIRFKSRSIYSESKSPQELRMYARVLRAVGLDEEVEAFQLEERALATEAEYARFSKEPQGWNALGYDLDKRLLAEV